MRLSHALSLIALLLLQVSPPLFAQHTTNPVDLGSLPADRFPEGAWTTVSWDDPGGWTVVDVTTQGIFPGIADASGLLSDIIDAATVPTIFYFPPGSYTFLGPVDIKTDNVIIRGAGSNQTQFYLDGSGDHEIRFLGWDYDPISVIGTVQEGSNVIPLQDASSISVGDLVEVSQELYTWDAEWGKRSWGQVVVVTAVNGNEITVDLPLSLGLDPGQQPEVSRLRPIRNVGVEDLYIERRQYGESSNIEMRTVYNAFVRNVESYNAVKFHVFLNRCRQVVISGNYIHDTQNFGGGGHGYGVNLENLSTNILVTNNIFKNLRHHILVQTGTNHSIVSYNYNVDIVELVDLSLHGHYSNHNLYEGNIVWWAGFADFWGQLGPENTLFRNQVWGRNEGDDGTDVYDNSDRQNLIGNDYLRNSTISKDADVDDTFEEGNLINGSRQWNTLSSSSTIPPSLYLDTAPDFWDANLAWPPYGPGVAGAEFNKIPAQLRYENIIGIDDPGDQNEPPLVTIDTPLDGANFPANSDIVFQATAEDTDGSIIAVDFYRDGDLVGSDAIAPYEYTWENATPGSYTWTAIGLDNLGSSGVSNEVSISVSEEENEDVDVVITGVLASESRENAGPANTLDGDLFTRWAAHGDPQWIQYNLSGVATIGSLGIAWRRGDTRVAYFDVAVSLDGENWSFALENAESSGVTDQFEYYSFDSAEAKYVRIIGHGTTSNAWNVIGEVDLNMEASTQPVIGDVTNDGSISALDASLALQHTVGSETLSDEALFAADVSGDGSVSALDASLILQYVASLISCFPSVTDCDATGD